MKTYEEIIGDVEKIIDENKSEDSLVVYLRDNVGNFPEDLRADVVLLLMEKEIRARTDVLNEDIMIAETLTTFLETIKGFSKENTQVIASPAE